MNNKNSILRLKLSRKNFLIFPTPKAWAVMWQVWFPCLFPNLETWPFFIFRTLSQYNDHYDSNIYVECTSVVILKFLWQSFYITSPHTLHIHHHHHHHHVPEGLGVFPVPWSSRWSWSLHLFLGRPMVIRPFGLYCSACFGSLFVSIFATCCSHFFWYYFISFIMFCALVFFS